MSPFTLLAKHTDIAWIASDEGVLSSSVGQAVHRDHYGHVTNPHFLYQPYHLDLHGATTSRIPAILASMVPANPAPGSETVLVPAPETA